MLYHMQKQETTGAFDKICILCYCGIKVCGNSPENVKTMLKRHQKSVLHGRQMGGEAEISNKENITYDWEIVTTKTNGDAVKRIDELNKGMIKVFGTKTEKIISAQQTKKEGVSS